MCVCVCAGATEYKQTNNVRKFSKAECVRVCAFVIENECEFLVEVFLICFQIELLSLCVFLPRSPRLSHKVKSSVNGIKFKKTTFFFFVVEIFKFPI